ncbi:MAG: NAD(P)-binding domain-containing protein [Actinomycetota bacterium]
MRRTTTVIIGAGHCGLAMSRRLSERSIDHVVLERDRVGSSWRTQRWDSMRLLTPNWQSRLPGQVDRPADPHGYARADEVAQHLSDYAAAISAPVERSTVTRVVAAGGGYDVVTDVGTWRAATLVVASGPANVASIPQLASAAPSGIGSRTPLTYRCPDDLPLSGVLVVGASASGVQLARELQRSGRQVTLSVGEHVRLPRTYRGRDLFWWFDQAGVLDERCDEIDDIARARRLPSPQLAGDRDRQFVDLGSLVEEGITVVGRLHGFDGNVARFSGGLANVCRLADLKMNRLLDRFDEWASVIGADVEAPERFTALEIPTPPLEVDLVRSGIGTIMWATGFRPEYPWLDLPVLDRRDRIVHDGGSIVGAPGAYVMGQPLLRRRRSTYISGAAADSSDLARVLHGHLDELAGHVSATASSRSAGRHTTASVAE